MCGPCCRPRSVWSHLEPEHSHSLGSLCSLTLLDACGNLRPSVPSSMLAPLACVENGACLVVVSLRSCTFALLLRRHRPVSSSVPSQHCRRFTGVLLLQHPASTPLDAPSLISALTWAAFTCPVLKSSARPRRCVSHTVTELFPLLQLSHRIDVSLLPFRSCRRGGCHAGGWHVVHEAAFDNYLFFLR